jgi:hypothetical protein
MKVERHPYESYAVGVRSSINADILGTLHAFLDIRL